jgi:hypothetical protein
MPRKSPAIDDREKSVTCMELWITAMEKGGLM